MKYYIYQNEGSSSTQKVLEAFAAPLQNVEFVSYDRGFVYEPDSILVLRSRSKEASEIIKKCWDSKYTDNPQHFIFIDTGFFNEPGVKKYHRIAINHFQNTMVNARTPDKRLLEKFPQIQTKAWRTGGETILLCPPSEKSLGAYPNLSVDLWIERILNVLHTNFPDKSLLVRGKPTPEQRRNGNSLQKALENPDIFAVATFQSGAASEAAIDGVPVFCDRNNAAYAVASTDMLRAIRPSRDMWLNSLAYDQWTLEEMASGEALHNIMRFRTSMKLERLS